VELLSLLDRLLDQRKLNACVGERLLERRILTLQRAFPLRWFGSRSQRDFDPLQRLGAPRLDRRGTHAKLLGQHIDASFPGNQGEYGPRALLRTATAWAPAAHLAVLFRPLVF
jgi:hypothetical protein